MKKSTTDCTTCIYDNYIWHDAHEYCCQKEKDTGTDLGYPLTGRQCGEYCRVPGSDDDIG